jgi:hypothetical protein
MTSLERCKHCGREIWPSGDGRYFHEVEYAGARYCKAGTVAEPKPPEAASRLQRQQDLHELQKPSGERSEFWEDESTARALLRIVIQLAEKAGLV